MQKDLEHLKLLSIFHYVVAGLTALFSLVPTVHLAIGLGLAMGGFPDADPGASTVGWFFSCFAAFFILLGLSFSTAIALAGRYLARRERYTFCLVVAACLCILMPYGTVLGVFTIIVLLRESVKALFEGQVPTSTPVPTQAIAEE